MAKSIYLLGSSHNVPLESYPEIVSRTAAMADVLGVEIKGEESLLSPKSQGAAGSTPAFSAIARPVAEKMKSRSRRPAADVRPVVTKSMPLARG